MLPAAKSIALSFENLRGQNASFFIFDKSDKIKLNL